MRFYRMIAPLLVFVTIQVGNCCSLVLSLDSCRTLAIENNKALKISQSQLDAAQYRCKSAFTQYLPKVSAGAMYVRTSKEVSLLSDEQKSTLSGIGDVLSYPALNVVGSGLVDALHTDTRNITGVGFVLTQPIYMGGKIRAYNNIAKDLRGLAVEKYNQAYQELLVEVDEVFWNIVLMQSRKTVAESYLNLVKTLDRNIQQMIEAGMATNADGLSVKVKVNEADVAIIQVDNGIEILKMRLCQLCGLSMDTDFELADSDAKIESIDVLHYNVTDVKRCRPELAAMNLAVKVYAEKERISLAESLPTVVLTGSYLATNPSLFNSFEKKMRGMWSVGVAVNMPILTWGDRWYKRKMSRAETIAAQLEYEETIEKVDLQVNQCRQRFIEAEEKCMVSRSSQDAAEENLRYATIGVKEGVVPVANVLEAQSAWLAAKTNLINAQIDLKLADTYLRKALGIIK